MSKVADEKRVLGLCIRYHSSLEFVDIFEIWILILSVLNCVEQGYQFQRA